MKRSAALALAGATLVLGMAVAGEAPAHAVPTPISGWTCQTPQGYDPDLVGFCDVKGLTPAQHQYRLVAKCSDGSTHSSSWWELGYTANASCPHGTHGLPSTSYYQHR